MLNEVFQDRPGNARFYLCPEAVLAGDVCMFGARRLPGVALEDYNAERGGTVFRFSGTYAFPIIAATTISPITGSEVLQGDTIYGHGTVDSPTNVLHISTLSKQSSGGAKAVGTYDSPTSIASGSTDTGRVRLMEATS